MTKFHNEYLAYQSARKTHWLDFLTKKNNRGEYYHHRLSEIYKNKVSINHTILELGCGNGRLSSGSRAPC